MPWSFQHPRRVYGVAHWKAHEERVGSEPKVEITAKNGRTASNFAEERKFNKATKLSPSHTIKLTMKFRILFNRQS